MEYVYASLLLHDAKQTVTEESVSKVLKAAGVEVDDSRVKALIASLKDVNIEEAIAKASATQTVAAAPAAAPAEDGKTEGKKEEDEEDTGKAEEAAAEGLGSLFG
jgi:large subunit ribosomal protein L12